MQTRRRTYRGCSAGAHPRRTEEPEAVILPRISELAQLVQSQPAHAAPAPAKPASWPTCWRMGARSWCITVRSVVCGRAESIGAQQVPVADPQVPQAYIGRTVWPAVQVTCEYRREQVGVPGEVPIVWSPVIWRSWPSRSRNMRESPMRASAARPPANVIAVSMVSIAVGVGGHADGRIRRSWLSRRTAQVSDETAAASTNIGVIAARRFGVHGTAAVAKAAFSFRHAGFRPAVSHQANPQNVRRSAVPSACT